MKNCGIGSPVSVSGISATPFVDPNTKHSNFEPPVLINAAAFTRLARNKNNRYGPAQIFSLSVYQTNQVLEKKELLEQEIADLIPKEYHKFLLLFSKAIADKLPPHRSTDHKIKLR